MAKSRTLEQEISDFVQIWLPDKLTDFLGDLIPLLELYDVEDENDWVVAAVGEENERNVRLLRSVYLLSRIADFHAGKLCSINVEFKNLWKKMEKQGLENGQEDQKTSEGHEEVTEARIVSA